MLDAATADTIVGKYIELLETGNEEVVEAFAAPDIVDHVSGETGHAFWHVLAGWVQQSFADDAVDVHAVMHDDNRVMCWFTARGRHIGNGFPQLAGRPITNREITWHQVHIFRVSDGRAVEHWGVRDDLAMLRQLEA